MKKLPRPENNESYSSFLSRFLLDINVILEFESTNQQEAVALAIFETTIFEENGD